MRLERGEYVTFTITPNVGYMLGTLVINGVSVTPAYEYTVRNIDRDIVVEATFAEVKRVEIKVQATVQDGINFDFGTANLTDDSRRTLAGIHFTMSENPEMAIEIMGHTDIRGTRAFNMTLSRARAQAVVDYLVYRGISHERLLPTGYGPDRPIADNSTDEGRAINRRVEIRSIQQNTPEEEGEN